MNPPIAKQNSPSTQPSPPSQPRGRQNISFDNRLRSLVAARPLTVGQLMSTHRRNFGQSIYSSTGSVTDVLTKAASRGAIKLVGSGDSLMVASVDGPTPVVPTPNRPTRTRPTATNTPPPSPPHPPRAPVARSERTPDSKHRVDCGTIAIHWPPSLLPHEREEMVLARIQEARVPGDFSAATNDVLNEAIVGPDGRRLMTFNQARHLYNKTLEQKVRDDKPRLKELCPQLVAAYREGRSYVQIAQEHDLSPLKVSNAIKKTILQEEKQRAEEATARETVEKPDPSEAFTGVIQATAILPPTSSSCQRFRILRSVRAAWLRFVAAVRLQFRRRRSTSADEHHPLLSTTTTTVQPAQPAPPPDPEQTITPLRTAGSLAETVADRWRRVAAGAVKLHHDQLAAAEQADQAATRNEEEVLKYSRGFEKQLEAFFTENNVEFRTEEQLAAEQTAEHGRLVCTPDILFTNPITINGSKVYWLDAKCYYLPGGCEYLRRSLDAQIARCNKHFGPGAIVFKYGCSSAVASPSAIMLSFHTLKYATVTKRDHGRESASRS
eukprot:m.34814 g.34814  ORF g.34814 m.34814 type:complete len:551 (-) comp7376_c0_seq1:83-1735(-)